MTSLTRKLHPDRSKIDLRNEHEVKHWIKVLRVSKEDLEKAIAKVGNNPASVRKELGILEDPQ